MPSGRRRRISPGPTNRSISKSKFGKAVDYVKEQVKRFSKEDMDIIDNIIENFIDAEDQMLEDTFVLAFKYAYKIFNEIKG